MSSFADVAIEVFENLINEDKEIRERAEKTMKEAKKNPSDFASVAIKIWANSPDENISRQTGIQIRDVLKKDDNIDTAVIEEIKSAVAYSLLNDNGRDDIGFFVDRLAQNYWASCITDLVQLAETNKEKIRLDRLMIVIQEAAEWMDVETADWPTMLAVLESCITHADANVVSEACNLLVLLVRRSNTMRDTWSRLSKLTPAFLLHIRKLAFGAEGDEQADETLMEILYSMESLTEVIGAIAFFTPHASDLFDTFLSIISSQECESHHRRLSSSIVEAIVVQRPIMCKDVPGLSQKLVEVSFKLILEVDSQDDVICDEYDDIADDQLNDCGECLLDRVTGYLGNHVELLPIVFNHVKALIGEKDWKFRFAAIQGLKETVEYIPKSSQKTTLVDIVPVVLSCMGDSEAAVRFAACRCVSQIAYDLRPLPQIYHKDAILEAICTAMNDSIPRVQEKALRSYINFIQELPAPDLEPFVARAMETAIRVVKDDKQTAEARSEALSCLSITAKVCDTKFEPWFHQSAEVVMALITNSNCNVTIRSTAIVTMSMLCIAVKKVEDYAKQFFETLRLSQSSADNKDGPFTESATHAIREFVEALGPKAAQFIQPVMEEYLPRIKPVSVPLNPLANEGINVEDVGSIQQNADGSYIALPMGVCTDIRNILFLIGFIIDACKENFIPFLESTIKALVDLISSDFAPDFFDAIGHALRAVVSIMTSPEHLSTAAQLIEKLAASCIENLKECLVTEYDGELYQDFCITAVSLQEVYLAAPKGSLSSSHIASVTKDCLEIVEKTHTRELKVHDAKKKGAVDAEEEEALRDELVDILEFEMTVACVIGGLMTSHPEEFMAVSGEATLKFICDLVGVGTAPELYLAAAIVADVNKSLPVSSFWPSYMPQIIEGCASSAPYVRHMCSFAVKQSTGDGAFDGEVTKAAVTKLVSCVGMKDESREESPSNIACDNAIGALLNIIINKGDFLGDDIEKVFDIFYAHYPLDLDDRENIEMAKEMVEAITKDNKHLLGANYQRLGKVLASLCKTYRTTKSDDETNTKIEDLVKLLGVDKVKTCSEELDHESKEYVNRLYKAVFL